jgi:hypothetical protein
MNEETKQFVIKLLVAGAVVLGLYFIASPYQNCVRAEMAWETRGRTRSDADLERLQIQASAKCNRQTTW